MRDFSHWRLGGAVVGGGLLGEMEEVVGGGEGEAQRNCIHLILIVLFHLAGGPILAWTGVTLVDILSTCGSSPACITCTVVVSLQVL